MPNIVSCGSMFVYARSDAQWADARSQVAEAREFGVDALELGVGALPRLGVAGQQPAGRAVLDAQDHRGVIG